MPTKPAHNGVHELPDAPVPKLLTAKKVAEYLGLTEAHVKNLIRQGTIPGTNIGTRWFIRVDALNELFPGSIEGAA
jgi:excisionase family DNA binding protein